MALIMRNVRWVALVTLGLAFGEISEARISEIPSCDANNGAPLSVDNARVVEFKFSTPNQFLERARVKGPVTRILGRRPSHDHFEIQIGPRQQDTLEVVFNRDFGNPAVKLGDAVEACGDYITSNAPTPRYQASPSGAIIHWVHENPRNSGHPHGYVVVNGRYLHGFGRTPIEVAPSDSREQNPPKPDSRGRNRRGPHRDRQHVLIGSY
jgi:hypothetical protein